MGLAVGTLVVDVFEIVDAERDQAQAEDPATQQADDAEKDPGRASCLILGLSDDILLALHTDAIGGYARVMYSSSYHDSLPTDHRDTILTR